MSDSIFAAIADWGVPLLMLVTFMSCLALPVPASLAMLAAGAFSASGEMTLGGAALGAFAGAVAGDQAGYRIGRAGRGTLARLVRRRPRRRKLLERARRLVDRHGGPGIFLSRWLVSPLGPYANFAAGLTGMKLLGFTAWGAAGEAVWVFIYVGLGWAFADRLTMVAELASDLSGVLAALALMVVTGYWMSRSLRKRAAA
ncbi:MAG: DedA family protein [Pseudooceanicola sp.]